MITVTAGTDAVAANATSHVITHNLGNASAFLIGVFGDWNTGAPFKTAQDANTITVGFPNEAPGSQNIDWSVGE